MGMTDMALCKYLNIHQTEWAEKHSLTNKVF